MNLRLIRAAWILALVAALSGPLVLRLITLERTSLWTELSVITGLEATGLLVSVVVMSARVKSITRAFGMAITMSAHRMLGLLTVAMMAGHVVAVLIANPASVALLSPAAPARAVFAQVALYATVALSGLTALRARQAFQAWRWVHIGLTATILAGTAGHVVLLQHLILDPISGAWLGAAGGLVAAVSAWRWLSPLSPRSAYMVVDNRAESPTVTTLVLRPRAGETQALRFKAGQFAWLRLGRAPVDEHAFTISSAEGDDPAVTFRHRGAYTSQRLSGLRPGSTVWLDGPHGDMTTDGRTRGVVLIAAGMGITPMMSMVRTMAARRDPRSVRVILADAPGNLLFRGELQDLRGRLEMDVHEMGRSTLTPRKLGALLPDRFVRDRLDYFVCGPPAMVDATVSALTLLGVPDPRVHTELFDIA